jgi:amidohydrolase
MPSPEELAGLVEEVSKVAVELRRTLHQHPEPSHAEHETTALISGVLSDYRIDHSLRTPSSGLWLDIGADPKVGFRADLDALPIEEPAENAPRSRNPGWMHACGHDAHAAIAVGIALVFNKLNPEEGVRVIFQPAEESIPSGAAQLVAEGLVDGLKGLVAFHVDPTLEVGKVGAKVGAITGSADGFNITIHGPGGHTARPEKTVDVIDAAARVVRELPGVVRHGVDSRVPMAMVFGAIRGGDAGNVIPTTVSLRGTIRTLDMGTWDVMPVLIENALSHLVAVAGADYTLEYQRGIPPVINDRAVIEAVTGSIAGYWGEEAIVDTDTSMGGEDFANYLSIVPGALLRLGAFSGGGDLHSSSFRVNEASIPFGIKAGVTALLGMLERF